MNNIEDDDGDAEAMEKLDKIFAEEEARDDEEISDDESEGQLQINEFEHVELKPYQFNDSDSSNFGSEIDKPDEEEEEEEEEEEDDEESSLQKINPDEIETIKNSIKLNQELIDKYKEARALIESKLRKCEERSEEINSKIRSGRKLKPTTLFVPWTKAGMPYFKDSKSFPAPLNEDTQEKIRKGELMLVYQPRASKWSKKDREKLTIKIRKQVLSEYFEREINQAIDLPNYGQNRTFLSLVGPIGSREFDWMKLSVELSNNRHTPEEIRVMWNVYCHPDINKSKWKNQEDENLQKIAKTNKYQNWDKIAIELNTKRSGYQCFIRYNTIRSSIREKETPWTEKEGNILLKCIDKLRIGDYIPWSALASYFDTRTKNQIYGHWRYNKNPTIKKGRFTEDEDQTLLAGVEKYGRNFSLISTNLMPNRTCVQLKTHFTLLMNKSDPKFNIWTRSDDERMLKLVAEIGCDWQKVAKIMDKNRVYLRHRYLSVLKYLEQGKPLKEIPRKRLHNENGNNDDDDDDPDETSVRKKVKQNETEMEKIDEEIYRFIKNVHLPTANKIGRPIKTEEYHDPVESAKELYKIFEILGVTLDMPDDFLNNSELTDDDKDILFTFKQYYQGQLPNNVDEVMKKMFGSSDNSEYTEHFTPPAPFGLFQNEKKNSMIIQNENIDAEMSDEKYKLVLKRKMTTPNNIDNKLSSEEKKIFDKFNKLINLNCKFGNGTCEKQVPPGIKIDTDRFDQNQPTRNDIEKMCFNDNDKIRSRVSIEPSLSTIIAYDVIKSMRKDRDSIFWTTNDVVKSKKKVTPAGKRAFHTFRDRFYKLFRYPIVMSTIEPVEVGYGIDFHQQDCGDDEDENIADDDEDDDDE